MKIIMKLIKTLALLSIVFSFAGAAFAEDWSKLSKKQRTTLGLYMTSTMAYDYYMKNMDNTLFVDTRTPSELNYLGTPTITDAHIPTVFMDVSAWNSKKHRYKRATNENFTADMAAALKKKGLTKEDTVILMCRSGKRTASAANVLAKIGYTKVYTVTDGYEGGKAKTGKDKGKRVVNGWKNSGLPWTYSLDGDILYYMKK